MKFYTVLNTKHFWKLQLSEEQVVIVWKHVIATHV
jgi:hypothetical protein